MNIYQTLSSYATLYMRCDRAPTPPGATQTPSTSHKTCFRTRQKYTQCCHEQHNLLNIFTAERQMAMPGWLNLRSCVVDTEHSNQLPCSPPRLRITCLGHYPTRVGGCAETAHFVSTDLLGHSCNANTFFAPADTPRAA